METPIVRHIPATAVTRSTRARVVSLLGPTTVACGLIWGILQPYRLTILRPRGQGFWWLLAEAPLYVMLVGLLFRLLLAPGIVEDIRGEG
jgi:hypothetical protein